MHNNTGFIKTTKTRERAYQGTKAQQRQARDNKSWQRVDKRAEVK